MIRSLWVALTLAVGTLIFAPPIIIARMLGVADGPESIYDRCMRRWARMVIRAAGVALEGPDQLALLDTAAPASGWRAAEAPCTSATT